MDEDQDNNRFNKPVNPRDDEYNGDVIAVNSRSTDSDLGNQMPDNQPVDSYRPAPFVQKEPQVNNQPIPNSENNVVKNVAQPVPAQNQKVSAKIILLQWVTYVLWVMTITAASILASFVWSYFITPDAYSAENAVAYSMAPIIVLLPAAAICDLLYAKREPDHKTGASAAAMIVLVVILTIVGAGSLITLAMSIMNLMISTASVESSVVPILSSATVAALTALIMLRALMPKPILRFKKQVTAFIVIVILVICGLGFFGPMLKTLNAKTDTLLENEIQTISSSISEYTDNHYKLPEQLDDLSLTGKTKEVVDQNFVEYKRDTKRSTYEYGYNEYYYQLCVNYQHAKTSSYSKYYSTSNSDYSSYPSTDSHPSGRVCYNLKSSSSASNNDIPVIDNK